MGREQKTTASVRAETRTAEHAFLISERESEVWKPGRQYPPLRRHNRFVPNWIGRLIHFANSAPLWLFLRGMDSILDVGCGVNSPVNYFVTTRQHMDGVDISEYDLRKQRRTKYRAVYCCDIRDFEPDRPYDLVTALDFVEHFEKEDGWRVLEKLERIARKRVLILTPNGYVPEGPQPGNPFQEHKSGWTADEFRRRGYRVYGLFGPKAMRISPTVIRHRPKVVFAVISFLASLGYFWLPERSYHLLAVRDRAPNQAVPS